MFAFQISGVSRPISLRNSSLSIFSCRTNYVHLPSHFHGATENKPDEDKRFCCSLLFHLWSFCLHPSVSCASNYPPSLFPTLFEIPIYIMIAISVAPLQKEPPRVMHLKMKTEEFSSQSNFDFVSRSFSLSRFLILPSFHVIRLPVNIVQVHICHFVSVLRQKRHPDVSYNEDMEGCVVCSPTTTFDISFSSFTFLHIRNMSFCLIHFQILSTKSS